MSRRSMHGWMLMGMLVITVFVALAIPTGIYLTRKVLMHSRRERLIGVR